MKSIYFTKRHGLEKKTPLMDMSISVQKYGIIGACETLSTPVLETLPSRNFIGTDMIDHLQSMYCVPANVLNTALI
jgi:hypothetical protein